MKRAIPRNQVPSPVATGARGLVTAASLAALGAGVGGPGKAYMQALAGGAPLALAHGLDKTLQRAGPNASYAAVLRRGGRPGLEGDLQSLASQMGALGLGPGVKGMENYGPLPAQNWGPLDQLLEGVEAYREASMMGGGGPTHYLTNQQGISVPMSMAIPDQASLQQQQQGQYIPALQLGLEDGAPAEYLVSSQMRHTVPNRPPTHDLRVSQGMAQESQGGPQQVQQHGANGILEMYQQQQANASGRVGNVQGGLPDPSTVSSRYSFAMAPNANQFNGGGGSLLWNSSGFNSVDSMNRDGSQPTPPQPGQQELPPPQPSQQLQSSTQQQQQSQDLSPPLQHQPMGWESVLYGSGSNQEGSSTQPSWPFHAST